MYCRSCDSAYPIATFSDTMDDTFDDALANESCDRL